MSQSGIYEILNAVNGKRYVGSALHLRRRWIDHRKMLRRGEHDNQRLQRAWAKYGEPAFSFNILLVCAPANLILYERLSLTALRPAYNICQIAGSSLGTKRSAAFRAAQAARLEGKPLSMACRAAMSAARTGKKHSQLARDKMALAATGRILSAATREKIAAAGKRRHITEPHKQALAAGRVAYWERFRAEADQ